MNGFKKSLVKDILMSAFYLLAPKLGNRASILMYHSVGDNPVFFTVSEANFRKQIQFLSSRNFTFQKLSTLLDNLRKGLSINNVICLTFDDGYEDNFLNVLPLLKTYNIPATIFLTTDSLEGLSPFSGLKMLSKKQIKEMHMSGLIEFMPHTRSHQKLTKLTHEEMQKEIEESRAIIESITEVPAPIFSYPKGVYTQEIVSYLKQNKWNGAVTVKPGLVSLKSDPYLLPRNSIDSSTTFVQFKTKVSKGIEYFSFLKG